MTARFARATLVAAVLLGTSGLGIVRAEATGDLYVGSVSGVLEVVTAPPDVLSMVPLLQAVGAVEIRADGRELYAVTGDRSITRLDLESMVPTPGVELAAAITDLAAPRGMRLVAALPTLSRVAVYDMLTGASSLGQPLPGAVDRLAAAPDDNRVVATAIGSSWVVVLDPATGTMGSANVMGAVRAVAVDERAGLAIVATSAPDRLLSINLDDLAEIANVVLPGAPTAISLGNADVFVAIDRALFAVPRHPGVHDGATPPPTLARRWATLARPARSLTSSNDRTLVYAMETDRIEGFHTADATISANPVVAARTVVLVGVRAAADIVAMPGAQPLAGSPENGAIAVEGDGGSGSLDATSGDSSPPATDTVSGGAWRIAMAAIVPVVILVVLPLLAIGWLVISRTDPERGGRKAGR